MAWRDSEEWLNFVFLGDGRVKDEKERDESQWEIIMRNCDLTGCRVQVKSPFLIWQVQVPIRLECTIIRGFLTPIRHVVPQISHIHSYPAFVRIFILYLFSLSTTLPSSKEHIVTISLCVSPHNDYELIPSTAYTEYNIY